MSCQPKKTLLQQGILQEDKPEPKWIGECHFCNAIYSGTRNDIVIQDEEGQDCLDQKCNFCGRDRSVQYYDENTPVAQVILAKIYEYNFSKGK